MSEKWRNWWKAAGVRAIKTVAQAAIGTIGASALLSEVDWLVAGLPEVEV